MYLNNCTIEVVIKNRPLTEYFHRGQTFVEGREGSEYELRFTNNNAERVEVILSVDGLSIIDGKEAGMTSSGYLVEARSTITIPGWMVDGATAAHFAFTGKKSSYATQATGSPTNNGVIGAMVFKEKANPYINSLTQYHTTGISAQPFQYQPYPYGSDIFGTTTRPPFIGIMTNNVSRSATASNSAVQSSSSIGANAFSQFSHTTNNVPNTQTLGTEFGKATEFQTTKVSFVRGDLLVKLALYYDEKSGLAKRGIKFTKANHSATKPTPDPFPAMTGACVPPPGWNG